MLNFIVEEFGISSEKKPQLLGLLYTEDTKDFRKPRFTGNLEMMPNEIH